MPIVNNAYLLFLPTRDLSSQTPCTWTVQLAADQLEDRTGRPQTKSIDGVVNTVHQNHLSMTVQEISGHAPALGDPAKGHDT